MNEKELQELIKEEKREYMRDWRSKNREKVAANNARYWAKKAAERKAKQSV
ncbi:hypothetical protein [Bacillus toyonensis]|uniref:hypothetical protein n=1 Tax=Bacillus toyonensis TaxID=155322 RepID=UPI00027BEAA0|nr:hypothetical protein [Bacillus toyonensis]EJV41768.1 hypothetical protein IEA_05653 [Bacillus toyonensis]